MSFSTGCRKCQKCGKMYLINLFDGGLCAECEKAEQEPTDDKCHYCEHNFTPYQGNTGEFTEQEPAEKITLWGGEQFVNIETYQQVCKERDIAIEQLHELGYEFGQKIEQCDDAISRQAIMKLKRHNLVEGQFVSLYDIERLPSVQPKPKTGHWIEIDDEPHEVWECDHCGFVIDGSGCIEPYEYRDTYKYCPNCGARMVEPQESEK